MFSEANIVVTIGNYGAVVAFHGRTSIENKIFLDELNEEAKKQLRTVFEKNKSAHIYVLLDTVDQSYKKKVYPLIRKSDLVRIVKRDMTSDGDKESLKNYIILNTEKTKTKQKASKRECLFVSSSNSEVINRWLEFLLDMPNRLVGIYMLPIETYSLFKLLKNDILAQSKIHNKKNNLYCLVMQNKVSGIRQVVLSDQGIIFTRVVNYNFEQADFLEKYEQDIYSTFEYLKRLFPDLLMVDLDIINIFPKEILESIKRIQNVELNFIGYTPYEVATKTAIDKVVPENSNFCDLLISRIFSKEKKILKFTIPKIVVLEKFFLTLKVSYFANLLLAVLICATIVISIFSESTIRQSIDLVETQKFSALETLLKLKRTALIEGTDISKVTDFGKMEEALGSVGIDFTDYYINLKFLKDFDVKLNSFGYSVSGFNAKAPTNNTNYQISFGGTVLNKSGDIEDLFKEFDALVNEVKKNLSNNQIKYSELPRDINFNQKYYSFPIDFTLTKK